MKDLSYILQDEFIGLNVKVVKCTNPSCVGLSGKIIDETRNTFRILCKGEEKVLIGRPEDRVKKVIRRRW